MIFISEEPDLPGNKDEKNSNLNKTSKSIIDYFKSNMSSTTTKQTKSQPKKYLSEDKIKEALIKCDEIVASHSKNNSDTKSNKNSKESSDNEGEVVASTSKDSNKNESRLLKALDDLDEGPTWFINFFVVYTYVFNVVNFIKRSDLYSYIKLW